MFVLVPMPMKHECAEEVVTAWARLIRAEQALLARIEGELKAAGFPPLAWYDVLLELGRTENGRLRPVELERHTLLAQYNASRLIDRMEEPSQSMARIWTRLARGSLFIPIRYELSCLPSRIKYHLFATNLSRSFSP